VPRPHRSEHGQATLEYLVLIAVVLVVVGAGGLAAAPGVANAVVRGLHHALCVVGGGDCLAAQPEACVVRRDATDEQVTLKVALLRVGDHAGILRQDLSDGSADVTEVDDLSVGAEVGLGARARVAVGGIAVGGGAGVSAAAAGWLGHTRTFHVRDGRGADRLIGRLTHESPATIVVDLPIRLVKHVLGLDHHDGVPPADERTFAGGGEASATLERGRDGDLTAAVRASGGGSWDRRTGRRTYFAELDGDAQHALRGGLGLTGEGSVVVGVTFSRAGAPLELAVHLVGQIAGGGPAPAGLPDGPALPGGRVEVDAALDLTVSDNAAAARAFLHALRRVRGGAAARAAVALARRLLLDGSRDVRVYASSSSSQGVGGEIGIGGKAGLDVSLARSAAQLRAAWSRPAGGLWEQRVDCVARWAA
jgi:hypothetical protein